ncbi:hypothetical protein ZIOFF_032805 [Zingiber officinale]|uniref:Uncharacterized protein n=1 Tax=Zingiber officinale TaxID=94328 RepID=A0A8J5GN92_ZINOF|nr:hypothetical protein ZIOFF_032805 [Zingiber officinale]
MESTQESAINVMNQDFVKLDRLDGMGTNFNQWKDKFIFFLTALKVTYVLNLDLPVIPPPTKDDSEELRKQQAKREEDEVLCSGHILNTLLDTLYDLFTAVKNPREIWTTLEHKYATQEQGSDKFLVKKYFEFKLDDNSPLIDQIHNLFSISTPQPRSLPKPLERTSLLQTIHTSYVEKRRHDPKSFGMLAEELGGHPQ